MAIPEENYIILKGCTDPKETGSEKIHDITIRKFMTPAAARKTGLIEISIYANFEKSNPYET